MKKLFNLFSVLFVAGVFAVCFASCSNASSSSSSSKNLIAKYSGSLHGGTDTIYVYDDNTWEEKYSDGVIYTKGTYEILSGNEINGTFKLKVSESKLASIPVGAEASVTINNGRFTFMGTSYSKVD